MKVGLVLGAGGTVGMAYIGGVLRALHQVGGYDASEADLVIGTSAGSVVGAYLRSGWTTADFWAIAMGGPAPGRAPMLDGPSDGQVDLFTRAFRTPVDAARRGLGSAYVLSRSVVRVPTPPMPDSLRRMFPAGMFHMTEGRRRFHAELPTEWPVDPLWLCTVDVTTGRRVVLGRRGAPPGTLQDAVMASCAIPGMYAPVKVGERVLIDGGIHSTSNLDLASRAGCDVIIGVIPMAFDTQPGPDVVSQLVRRLPSRRLAAEVAAARRRGVKVLLFRPTADEVRLHGLNLMRRTGWDTIAQAAYDATARTLDASYAKTFLADHLLAA